MNEKPKRIMSGEYSRDMWNAINSAETVEDLQDALYFVCCRLQKLESSLTTDAAEHHTSFIELKCHNCGMIIDAALTQMPCKQLCTKELL